MTPRNLDRDNAQTAVSLVSLGFGAGAVVAPVQLARLFGLQAGANPALPLLVRMVGVRNATMGAALRAAERDDDVERALKLGLAVGAVDAFAVLAASRRGVLNARSAVVALSVLGAIAWVGAAGLRPT